MRFQLILEDENGDRIDMTATANQYMISSIDGLYPPAGTISTAAYAGMNGSYLNNAFIEKCNIVINFQMRGVDIEKRRHALYSVVKPSRYIKVYLTIKGRFLMSLLSRRIICPRVREERKLSVRVFSRL